MQLCFFTDRLLDGLFEREAGRAWLVKWSLVRLLLVR